ncbi:GLUG motif-containing protein [Halovivax gelatinilyticus]|uniref:GLUG motif-containing protein n=1 Tax=Halovivax gelatinilyticus TaxID=2961597 RepID=UPI0020CA890C|nr:GLUG motif-containing protein [Halovivax gelatinilyticus]
MGGVAADTVPPDCNGVDFEQDSDGYYEVETLSQLQCIEEHGLEHDYALVEDIDANETGDWNDGDGFEPIGDGDIDFRVEGDAFNGTFDGNDRTIANLTIERGGDDRVGLFEVIGSEGTVSNLTLEAATVTGDDDVGSLSGQNYGTVSDVSMSTDVTGSGTTGGVIGWNYGGTITGATVEGTVFSEQDGVNTHVGGIVGDHQRGASIDSSSFTNGTVDGDNEEIGGIAGQLGGPPGYTSSITNSSANGTIGNEDADSVGGLVGDGRGDFFDSYSTATVRGNDTVGGVIGYGGNSDIERTYAVGEVDGDGDDVGGLVGVGSTGINIENSYWDTETTGVTESFDSDEGGLFTDEMTGANATEHMNGFGFPDGDDRWHAVEDDYPVLAWEDTDPVYGVEITSTNSAIEEGETLEVDATVTNLGPDGGAQSIELRDFDGDEVDSEEVTLESGESTDLTLEWETDEDEGGLDDVTVASENHTDTRAVSVGAGEVIPQCQTIDTAGAYELTDDIEASGECIEIEADDVSLDGNDHTISGSGTGIVVNDQTNVTITNVTLSGLDVGIEMAELTDATVGHNTVEGSDEDGLVFEDVQDSTIANNTVTAGATRGIHLAEATDTAVENNTLRENDESGMYVVDSEELVISGNEVVDNGEDDEDELSHDVEDAGIYLSGTADSTLEANNLTANAQVAMFLEESSADNRILGNAVNVSVIEGSERWRGIKIEESSGNILSETVITGSEEITLGEHGEDLIYVDSEETVVTDNEIYGHARVGIDILGESNTVDNNSIAGSFHHSDTQNGHAIRVSGTGEDWSVTNNSLTKAEILNPERAGIAIIGDQTVEMQHNTGTKLDTDRSTDPGTDLELTHVAQFVENQQLTTPAGETTVTFTGAGLRLVGVDDPPNAASPDDVESTDYYFEVENTSDEFTFEKLELDYDETRLTTGDTIDPETLSLWRLDSGEWEEIDDSGVDTAEQVVTGNVTEDGTIGAFGEQAFAAGTGSADDPFVIEDWGHLDNVRWTPNSTFTLANDLDSETDGYDDVAAASANDGDGFEPIDDFEGTFDGDSATISDLQIDRGDEADVGLFGSTSDSAIIDDVHLENATVTGESNVGGLVGDNQGTILESSAKVDVSGSDEKVGGLVGINLGKLTHSYATGDIDGDESVGGLVGQNYEDVSESYATASVNGSTFVGGLVGYNDGEVNESYAIGSVECIQTCRGLIAINTGDVEDSYWDTETTGQDDSDGGTPLSTAEMTGANATEYMEGFAFPDDEGIWHATDSYPVFALEDTDPLFGVQISETNSPIDQGDTLEVTADVTNVGADGEQTVELLDFEDDVQDSKTATLESGDTVEVTLAWETEGSDVGTGDVTVASENDADNENVTIKTGIASVTAIIDDEEIPTVAIGETVPVTVTAEDETGDPVEGAELSIDEIDDGSDDVTVDGLSVSDTETTDSDGVATFDGVTFSGAIDATVDVTVSATDGVEDEMTVTVGGFAEGDGSAADPFVIEDWNHLDNIRLHLEKEFELGANLDEETDGYDDLVGDPEKGWEPISDCGFDPWEDGCAGDGFSGTFDGQGYEIRALVIDREDAFAGVGLFNGTQGATIESVGLVDVDITGGFLNVGGLAGTAVESEITDSYATGDVTGRQTVGGLVGYNFGEIDDPVTADVEDSIIEDSYATSDVTGEDTTGGLVGTNWGIVENSYATGNVTATGPGRFGDDPRAGGLLGVNGESDGVIDSYWDDEAATVIEDGEEQHGQGIGGDAPGAANVTTLTTIEMTGANAQDNTDLDFADTWGVVDDPEDGNVVSYPLLQNATQDPAPGLRTRYAGGDGSADDPYIVEDWYHLDNVRENLDANFTVTNELNEHTAGYSDVASEDANGGDGFEPIGDAGEPFGGIFDGNGSTISDFVIDRDDEDRVGLFASTSDSATIDDVHLENATVSGESTVGGLVGSLEGTVSSSSTNVTVAGEDGVGGLVGENAGEVTTTYAVGDVSGDDTVGGLVGHNTGEGAIISQSYAAGNVTGDDAVGGLVGTNGGDVTASYWDVETTGQDDSDGATALSTAEMTGANATEYMDGFAFPDDDGTWHATDSYPVFAWEDSDPFFGVNVTLTNSPIDQGDTLEVTVAVTNWGADGEQTVTLARAADSEPVEIDDTAVSLDSGERIESVTLTWETGPGDAGEHDVAVSSANRTDTETVAVDIPQSPPSRSDISVIEATLGSTQIYAEESVAINATVENDGQGTGTETIEVSADGETVATETVTIGGGSEKAITVIVPFEDEGAYDVAVGDVVAGEVVVVAPPKPEFTISGIDPVETTAAPGAHREVLVTLANEGDGDGEADVELQVENHTRTERVGVSAGEEVDVGVPLHTAMEYGEFEYIVSAGDDEAAGTLVIASGPKWVLGDVSATPDPVEPGGEVDLSVTLENIAEDGTVSVEFFLEDELAGADTVDVASDETDTAEIRLTAPEEEGTYEVAVSLSDDGELATSLEGELVVDDPDGTSDGDDAVPGFGPLTALLALGCLAVGFGRLVVRNRPS